MAAKLTELADQVSKLHSLMLVLLNGGMTTKDTGRLDSVALVDACVTEWRDKNSGFRVDLRGVVALVDACVTEWRTYSDEVAKDEL